MDPIKLEKIQATNRYKNQQLLNNLLVYSLTALTCSFFCSSPLWYPPLFSCMKIFLSLSLPQVPSLLFSSKFSFLVGNIIVIFLLRESKILTSEPSSAIDVYYEEYVSSSRSLRGLSSLGNKVEAKLKVSLEEVESIICEGIEDKEEWIEENLEDDYDDYQDNHDNKEEEEEEEVVVVVMEEEEEEEEEEEVVVVMEEEKGEEEEEDRLGGFDWSDEEVNKRAEDFIARIKRQRTLEYAHLSCNSE